MTSKEKFAQGLNEYRKTAKKDSSITPREKFAQGLNQYRQVRANTDFVENNTKNINVHDMAKETYNTKKADTFQPSLPIQNTQPNKNLQDFRNQDALKMAAYEMTKAQIPQATQAPKPKGWERASMLAKDAFTGIGQGLGELYTGATDIAVSPINVAKGIYDMARGEEYKPLISTQKWREFNKRELGLPEGAETDRQIAKGAGKIVADVAQVIGTGGVVKAAGIGTNIANPIAQRALQSGVTGGASSILSSASDQVDLPTAAKNLARDTMFYSAGGAVSGKVNEVANQLILKYGLQNKVAAELARNALQGIAFDVGGYSATIPTYEGLGDRKPTAQEIGTDMAIGFLFEFVPGAYSTLKTTKANKVNMQNTLDVLKTEYELASQVESSNKNNPEVLNNLYDSMLRKIGTAKETLVNTRLLGEDKAVKEIKTLFDATEREIAIKKARINSTDTRSSAAETQTSQPVVQPATRINTAEPTAPIVTDNTTQKVDTTQGKIEPITSKGKKTVAYTADNKKIDLEYKVIDAKDLVTSHDTSFNLRNDYPQELQPRQRDRVAGQMQVENIMNNLVPELLGENNLSSYGSPITKGNIVESGNGRTLALKKGYETNNSNMVAYKEYLIANADKFGIDINNMPENPILVRERLDEMDSVAFSKAANVSSVAQMSAAETAINDADKMSARVLARLNIGDDLNINAAGNRDFITDFVNDVIPESERGSIATKDGNLSLNGIQRVKNALFQKAYGNVKAIEMLSESTDVNIKNVINAMTLTSPKIVNVKAGIKEGILHDLDISQELSNSAIKLSELKSRNESVELTINQIGMFNQMSDVEKTILTILDKNNKSQKKLKDFVSLYYDMVEKAGNPNQVGLTDHIAPTKLELLEATRRVNENETGETITLWESERGSSTKVSQELQQAEGKAEYKLETDTKKINTMTWYHGSGTDNLSAGILDTSLTKIEGLFGQGIYLTTNPEIAKGYAKARGKKTGEYIYKSEVDIDKVINLDEKPSADIEQAFRNFLNMGVDGETLYLKEYDAKVKQGNTTGDLYKFISDSFSEYSSDNMIPKSEMYDIFDEFTVNLKNMGYDAFTHTGGKITGKEPHQVLIILDANDTISQSGRKNITAFGKVETKQEPKIAKIKANIKDTGVDTYSSTLTGPQLRAATGTNTDIVNTKKASEIYKEFSTKLGIAIRNRPQRGALGTHGPTTHLVKIKKANDLAVLSHETGHYFDKEYGFSKMSELNSELLKLGQATSDPKWNPARIKREGAAEFTRLYLTDNAVAKAEAPKMYASFTKEIDKGVLKVLDGLKDDIDKFSNLSAIEQAKKTISFASDKVTKEKLTDKVNGITNFERKAQAAYSAIYDRKYPLVWAAKKMAGEEQGKYIRDDISAARGYAESAEYSIKEKQTDAYNKEIGEGLETILTPVLRSQEAYDDFVNYALNGRRSIDYFNKGLSFPSTKEACEQVRIYNEQKYPEFIEIFDKLQTFQKNSLKQFVDIGMMSQNKYDTIMNENPNYIPGNRVVEALYKSYGSSDLSPVKRLKGGGQDFVDAIETIISNTYIHKKIVSDYMIKKDFIEIANSVEDMGHLVTKAPIKMQPTTLNMAQLEKTFKDVALKAGISEEEFKNNLDMDFMATFFRQNVVADVNQIALPHVENGEDKITLYDVDPLIYSAFTRNPIMNPVVNAVIKKMAVLTRIKKAGIIFTPLYVGRNLARDTVGNLVNSRNDISAFDIGKGMVEAVTNGDIAKLARKSGAVTGFFSPDRKFVQNSIKDMQLNHKKAKNFNEAVSKMLKNTGNIARDKVMSPGEMAGRLAEFEKTIVNQYKKAYGNTLKNKEILDIVMDDPKKYRRILNRAAFNTRDITVDFNRSGGMIEDLQINRVIAFFNPALQGAEKFTRSFADKETRGKVAAKLALTAAITMAISALLEGNENYEELPDYRKDYYINIPLGDPKTATKFIPIPMQYDVAFTSLATPRRLVEHFVKKNPKAFTNYTDTIEQAFMFSTMPDLLNMYIELESNKDWTGRPILNYGDEGNKPYLQYGDYTSETSKAIGYMLKDIEGIPEWMKSPKQLDHVIKGQFGTMGTIGLNSIDQLTGNKEGIPLLGGLANGFIIDATKNPKSINEFYENKKAIDEDYKEYETTGRKQKYDIVSVKANFAYYYKSVTEINKAIKELSDAGETEKVKELTKQRLELMQKANKIYHDSIK